MIRSCFLSVLVFVSFTASAQEFTYRVGPMDTHDLVDCFNRGKLIAADFAIKANVTVTDVDCLVLSTLKEIDLIIRYESDQAVEITTTVPDRFSHHAVGFWKTKQDCESKLLTNVQIFKDETQLEPFTSYCFSSNGVGALDWGIRIDAIGTGSKRPFTIDLFTDAMPINPSVQTVVKELADFHALFSEKLTHVAFIPHSPYFDLYWQYYGTAKRDLDLHTFFQYADANLCDQELKDLRAIATANAIGHVSSFCGALSPKSKSRDLFLLYEKGLLKLKKTTEDFKSFAKCLEAKRATVEKYRVAMGNKVLGGLCIKEPGGPFLVSLLIQSTSTSTSSD